MSWDKIHLPCPCGQSSDAYATNTDGTGKCFTCDKFFHNGVYDKDSMDIEIGDYTYEYLPRRGITRETHEFFGVRSKIDSTGKPVAVEYPYRNGAIKTRRLDKKGFYSSGPMSASSGWPIDKFAGGSSKSITITEGEDDAMSAWQMLGKYPVWTPRSSSSASADATEDFEYLNSFDRIYLALDNDDPGQKAARELAAIFGYGKVYNVKLAPYKDPHEFLEAGKVQEFRSVWYNASRYVPEGITSSFSEIYNIIDTASKERGYDWPFPTLTHLTGGIKLGRAYLFSGLEGIGKTSFFHAVEAHIAKTYPDENIGIIHLEEPLDETVKNLASYVLQVNAAQEDSNVSDDEVKAAYTKLAGRDDRIHFYHHFGSDDPDGLLSKIRFLVAALGCKRVFLDNITVLVTGRKKDDERTELDYLSTRLEMLVKELKFSLIMISHENKNQETRGSANISKVCDVWVNMTRDIRSENEFARRIIYLTIFKGRGCRNTGPAGRLIYDHGTGQLSELTADLPA